MTRARLARRTKLLAVGALALLGSAGCAAKAPAAHWPKSAGAIVPDDPAEDGGESLEPHRVGVDVAAVEHGGNELTSILDEPADPAPAATSSPAPVTEPVPAEVPDEKPEAPPDFVETIDVE